MKIRTFSFKNKVSGWNVKNVHFDNLTLFVGASGVGKTQILRAIGSLRKIVNGDSVNGAEWSVEFEENGVVYIWKGAFDALETSLEDIYHFKNSEAVVLYETLGINSKTIIDRKNTEIEYDGKPIVKLDANKSAISLLKEEELISPVLNAFRKVQILNSNISGLTITPSINEKRKSHLGIREIKNEKGLSPIEKLFLLKVNKLQEFDDIFDNFKVIFPLIEDVDFAIGSFFNEVACPILKMKEKGVKSWIFQPDISSGMLRTLSQITMLTLADAGDVFLIDEFENGLGVNCINQLAEMIMSPMEDVQVIMTSHHPYIINTIPFECWKIVTRSASDVAIHTPAEFNIGKRSRHEAFMQLIQTSAYKNGSL